MSMKWNGEKYSQDFNCVPKYGIELVDLISSDKNSLVLDLGCGNGELTNYLNQKGFRTIGLDSSTELLKIAKEQYPTINFIEGNVTNFKLNEHIDVIFSNAVFHWIKQSDQNKLINSIYNNLKPNGELIFECGGVGNNEIIHKFLELSFKENGIEY